MTAIICWLHTTALDRLEVLTDRARDEEGFSTAELLGNAALAIAALVVIWAGLRQLGLDVVTQMRTALSL